MALQLLLLRSRRTVRQLRQKESVCMPCLWITMVLFCSFARTTQRSCRTALGRYAHLLGMHAKCACPQDVDLDGYETHVLIILDEEGGAGRCGRCGSNLCKHGLTKWRVVWSCISCGVCSHGCPPPYLPPSFVVHCPFAPVSGGVLSHMSE